MVSYLCSLICCKVVVQSKESKTHDLWKKKVNVWLTVLYKELVTNLASRSNKIIKILVMPTKQRE